MDEDTCGQNLDFRELTVSSREVRGELAYLNEEFKFLVIKTSYSSNVRRLQDFYIH